MSQVMRNRAGTTHALAGIASAAAFVIAILLVKWPGGDDSGEDVASTLSTHGNRLQQYVAGYLLIAAALLFLWFIAGLRQRLAALDIRSSETVTWLTSVGGGIATALLLASGAISIFMAGTISFGEDRAEPDIVGAMGWIAGALTIFSMFAIAVAIAATSTVAARTAVFPRWFAWFGYVCVLALVLSLLYITMIAFPIWLIVASALLLTQREPVR